MAGTFYWIIQEAAHADPTRAQIVAGQNGSGTAAVASGSVADAGQSSPVDAVSAASGLSASTAYAVAWVWYDSGAPAESSVVVGAFSTLSVGTADLAASYAIGSPGESDLGCAYAIQSAGTADLAASYAIQSAGASDLACSYAIEDAAGAGASDLACSYAIEASGAADLSCSYSVAAAGSADISGNYAISGGGWADLAATFAIQAAAFSDLPCSYQIDGVAGSAVWPDPATVLIGVTYGPTGADYTGTMSSAADIAAEVLAAISGSAMASDIADAVWAKTLP